MGVELTTLQLAERIAVAVVEAATASGNGDRRAHARTYGPVVLRVLFETDSWFCRVSEDGDGLTVERPYEQVALF